VSETSIHGIIFDLQRFSLHDGPGIRTLVFFKGCPLRCLWCSNPESQRSEPEMLFDPAKCVACGGCVVACPHGAVWRADGGLEGDRARCVACGRCAEACPAEARTVAGRQVSVDEVVVEVLKDAPFFANSGGGVTLGGGEPMAQPDFAQAILTRCRAHGIHTAVETCGHVPWNAIERVLPWTDLFLYDVKHLDAAKHGRETGGEVGLVLASLERLVAAGASVIARVPVVPGFNDDPESILAIARLVASLGIESLHLLPYHRLGQGKYRLLGRDYLFTGDEKLPDATMQDLKTMAEAAGLTVRVGG
jgi:pyruvate formate lyase activating enzyme